MSPRSWYARERAIFSRALTLALWVALATAASGQQLLEREAAPAAEAVPASPETIQTSVDEVNMFFNVLDRHGRPVRGLQAPDFGVLDRGEAMPIRFFQSETDAPLSITVAIDLSGSEAGWVKYEVKVASDFLAKTVRPGDEAEIAGFGTQMFVARDLARAREHLLAIVKKNPKMGTAVFDAVRYSCRQRAEPAAGSRHRRILVLLTDGEDNSSRATAEEALRAVAESGTIVFVVYTGGDFPGRFLRTLAEKSGGRVLDARDIGNTAKALAKVATMLREQYLIAFQPPGLRQDGSFHAVKIELRRKGAKVYCRRGYYALAQESRR